MKKDLIATMKDNRLNPTFVDLSLLVQLPPLKAILHFCNSLLKITSNISPLWPLTLNTISFKYMTINLSMR